MLSLDRLKEYLSEVDVGKWLRLCRGLAILAIALMMISYTTSYVINEKIEMVYELEGFESLPTEIPDLESIFAARGVQFLITIFLIMMIIVLVVMFKGEDLNLIKLLTLIAHSFIVVAIFTALQLPFIWQIPRVSYMVVDAGFTNITFSDATIIGFTPNGSVEISSPIIKVGYARVYRAYPNLTIPDWDAISRRGGDKVREAIEDTKTYMNLSEVRWVSGDGEKRVEKLDLCRGNWSVVGYQDVMGRIPVREAEVGFHESMLGIFSFLSNIGLILYNSIGFRRIYRASMKLTILVAALLSLAILFFGGV